MRRLLSDVEAERAAARAKMSAFLGPDSPARARKPRKAGAGSASKVREAVADALVRLDDESWEDASPSTLVGLYAVLHEKVYGIAPEELVDGWLGAVSATRRLLSEPGFDGDPTKVVAFLRFTWKRERAAERKAGPDASERRRIGWRLQFASRALVVDWKRAILASRKEAARR